MKVAKIFHFEAAHVLPKHFGKCARLHGHSYQAMIEVEGPLDPDSGMVMDYYYLKEIVNERIFDILDHQFINQIFMDLGWPGETTAENICAWMWHQVFPDILKHNVTLTAVQVWETSTSYALLRAEDFDKEVITDEE